MEDYEEQMQFVRKDSKRLDYGSIGEGMSNKHMNERKGGLMPNKMYI
jgi:hypothetical protein